MLLSQNDRGARRLPRGGEIVFELKRGVKSLRLFSLKSLVPIRDRRLVCKENRVNRGVHYKVFVHPKVWALMGLCSPIKKSSIRKFARILVQGCSFFSKCSRSAYNVIIFDGP